MNPEVLSPVPGIAVGLPLAGAIIAYLAGARSPVAGRAVSLAVPLACLVLLLAAYPMVGEGVVLSASVPLLLPTIGLSFRMDILALFLSTLAAALWFLAVLFSFGYVGPRGANRYYSCLTLVLGGSLGVFLAGDLLSLFVFFEIMSLPAAVLIAHDSTGEAIGAALKYLFMTLGSSLLLLFSVIVIYQMTGSVALAGREVLPAGSTLISLAFLGFLIAFGTKAGMMPLHVWLPDAHPVAPSPASALLSGLMIKVGAYGLLRVTYGVYGAAFLRQGGWDGLLLAVAAITALVGSAVAVTQADLKRRLAYSSVAHMGLILLGAFLLAERALVASIFHLFAHGVAKACLFFCSGVIIARTGERDIRRLGGIGRRLPVTMGCFTLAAFTLVGVPPLNGFISKWQLGLGALDAGRPAYVAVLLAASLASAAYYLPIVIAAFFDRGTDTEAATRPESTASMLVPVVLLALACGVFALAPGNWPLRLAEMAARLLWHGGGGAPW